MADATYDESTIQLAPGDRVILHTDGITDQENVKGEKFGREKFGRLIAEHRDVPVEKAMDLLTKHVDMWSGGKHLDDDISVLAFEVR